ncbi:MAG: hypothetical protein LUJ25_04925 [Firmicutes bacterium]|nr:hypothetical protein [Bacillota bacterium]
MNENLIREIAGEILEAADTLRSKEELNSVEQGQMIAYAETLCIMQDALSGYDLAEYGLDFDVDKKYLL